MLRKTRICPPNLAFSPHSLCTAPMNTNSTLMPSKRRKLRFKTFDDIADDVASLSNQRLAHLGNWSLGQICKHLAAGMNCSIDGGDEFIAKYPLWHRFVGPLLKYYVLCFGLRPGYRLSGEPARVLTPEPTETAAGIEELMRAIERLKKDPHRLPRHVLGRFSRKQWDCYHRRHAELHLSFVVPLGVTT